jgi:predicted metalloprotease with PDZ domain
MKKTASFALVLLTVAATALAHSINPPVQGLGGKKNTNPDAAQLPLTGLAPRPVTALPARRRLTYTVEPFTQEDKYRLRVSLTFRGDSSGKTRLLLPLEWSAGVGLYRGIRDIQPLSEDTRIEDTREPHVKIAHHRANQRVSLTYEVVSQPPGTKLTREIYHYPVLRPSYFYVMGQALWVYPDMPESTPLQLSLHWKNIPDGWALINSYGLSQPKQIVKTTLESFRKGTYLAGDYRIKRIIINQEPVYAVTRGSFGFADEEFHKLVRQIFQVEREFWKTRGFPHYYVVLLPTDDPSGRRGGEGRTNSFTLYLPKDSTTLSEHRHVLAHELFHEWNPRRLGGFELIGGVEDERLYWFSEGFTDYYASVLLLRAGLISLEDYVADYNSLTEAYYASPVRLLTAAEMVQKRQTSYEVERLFYQRGALLAHYWDIAIRSRTNNKSSLDDVMRSLLKSAKARGFSLSHKRIAHALRPYLGEKGASDIEKYIDRGELVPADNPFGTCAIAEVINYHPWDMGFEADTSFKTRVISGVVPDSNAHRAGLRDGQKWVSGGFVHGDPNRLTKLTVIEGDTQKVVQFYPAATEAIRLPRYNLKPNLSAEERARCLSELGVQAVPQRYAKKPRRHDVTPF